MFFSFSGRAPLWAGPFLARSLSGQIPFWPGPFLARSVSPARLVSTRAPPEKTILSNQLVCVDPYSWEMAFKNQFSFSGFLARKQWYLTSCRPVSRNFQSETWYKSFVAWNLTMFMAWNVFNIDVCVYIYIYIYIINTYIYIYIYIIIIIIVISI